MKGKRLIGGLLLLLVCFTVQARTYEAIVADVDKCIDRQDWKSAEKLLKEALELEPGNPNNFLLISNLGTVHRNMGLLSESLADYNLALSITPNATTILHNRASLYLELDSAKAAFNDYRRIVALNGQDCVARNYLGFIAMEFGEMEQAKSCFDEVLKINPAEPDAKRGLALWNKLNGNYKEAVALYSEIIGREDRFTNFMNRAGCYVELEMFDEAQADLHEAQKHEPSNPDIFLLKAKMAQMQFRYDDAASYAKQAKELGCDESLVAPFLKKM